MDGVDELQKGNALIRQAFGIDPGTLSPEEWASRYHEALWLKKLDKRLLQSAVAQMFKT